MPKQKRQALHNALWRLRRREGLDQKQVAHLLGHQSSDTLSRYERGLQLPKLDNLLKLSLIYRASPFELYPEHVRQFRQEFEAYLRRIPRLSGQQQAYETVINNIRVCAYAKLLDASAPTAAEQEAVKKHVITLMQKLSSL